MPLTFAAPVPVGSPQPSGNVFKIVAMSFDLPPGAPKSGVAQVAVRVENGGVEVSRFTCGFTLAEAATILGPQFLVTYSQMQQGVYAVLQSKNLLPTGGTPS